MERAREIQDDEAPVTDSLGLRRRRQCGPDGECVLELKSELTQCASFEFALRERAGRLASFHAPGFVRVRRVERAPGTRALAIVSDAVEGVRLGDLIRRFAADRGRIPPEWSGLIVTQLASAVAALHATDPDVVHAALTPDRILVTPASQPLICEYVLGSAIEQLGYSEPRCWDDLGIAVPRRARPFDQRVDLLQLGFVALALFLGRPLDAQVLEPDVLRRQVEMIPAPQAADRSRVRNWIARLLELEPPFSAAADAAAQARSVFGAHESAADLITIDAPLSTELDRPIAQPETDAPAHESDVESTGAESRPPDVETAAPEVPVVAAGFVDSIDSALSLQALSPAGSDDIEADAADQGTQSWTSGPADRAAASLEPLNIGTEAFAIRPSPSTGGERDAARPVASSSIANSRRVARRYRWPAAAAFAIAAIGGIASIRAGVVHQPAPRAAVAPSDARQPARPAAKAAIGNDAIATAAAAPSATGALTIRTQPTGAVVSVDGSWHGQSPLTLNVPAGEHAVTVTADGSVVKTMVTVDRGGSTSVVVPLGGRSTLPVGGWVRVAAPFETQVFEGDQLVGSSASPRLMMTAGTHTIELVNADLGFRARRTVQVTGGQVTPLTIEAPRGKLAVNAQPWADVWLDGERVGSTPLGNLSAAIGTHDLVFRHPTLGERHHTVSVSLSGITRISVDMTRGES